MCHTKLKKYCAVSFLTSKKPFWIPVLCLIFVGVKVLLDAYLENKFEWVDIITQLTTASQVGGDEFLSKLEQGYIVMWDRCYLLILSIGV